jgi:hypothetical protein
MAYCLPKLVTSLLSYGQKTARVFAIIGDLLMVLEKKIIEKKAKNKIIIFKDFDCNERWQWHRKFGQSNGGGLLRKFTYK